MKTRQWQEMKNFSKEELLSELDKMQKKLFELKLKHSVVPLKNPLEIRLLRRDIARIKTLLLQKFGLKI